MFGNKVAKVKISSSTAQVLELEAQKKRLEMERDQIQIELQNQKKREGMKLEEEAHKQKLKLQEETAVFNREKLIWEKEKQELIDRAARERKEFEDMASDSTIYMGKLINTNPDNWICYRYENLMYLNELNSMNYFNNIDKK